MDSKITTCVILLYLLILFSCDPKEAFNPKYRGTYSIKNSSGISLKIVGSAIPLSILEKESVQELYFGDGYKNLGDKYRNNFFYDVFGDYEKDSIVILSTKGDTLKIWREVEKDSSERQYYHHSFWEETQEKKEGHICINWLFELLPEDLDMGK